MMMRMTLMILTMSSIMHKELAMQDANGKEMILTSHLPLDMNLNSQFPFSQMGIR
jgi:hypothetical protein